MLVDGGLVRGNASGAGTTRPGVVLGRGGAALSGFEALPPAAGKGARAIEEGWESGAKSGALEVGGGTGEEEEEEDEAEE
jgi:hypothetical protein